MKTGLMKTVLQAVGIGLIGLVVFGLLLFLPAWTFYYWQAWVFIVVFTAVTSVPSVYLALKNPAALQRRMHAGPTAETRTVQKFISTVTLLLLPVVIVFSAFGHRFGWSPVPAAVSVIGDALVAIGLGIVMLVIIQNSYAAANITVESGQKVISSGLYGLVRHPMYVGVLIMMLGIPLALDSWWGLVVLIPDVIVFILRILDEEKMLKQELDGYNKYTQEVHYRLVPYIW
ncbi:MAG TPA: isoprenylcysteine carboxylmethyltransferase family protein [Ktedonobacteraceae bacterium]|nr:isoprenylcysteine carboxylmethyltransferase family protein [Ktedonobacteraceae bacterium]